MFRYTPHGGGLAGRAILHCYMISSALVLSLELFQHASQDMNDCKSLRCAFLRGVVMVEAAVLVVGLQDHGLHSAPATWGKKARGRTATHTNTFQKLVALESQIIQKHLNFPDVSKTAISKEQGYQASALVTSVPQNVWLNGQLALKDKIDALLVNSMVKRAANELPQSLWSNEHRLQYSSPAALGGYFEKDVEKCECEPLERSERPLREFLLPEETVQTMPSLERHPLFDEESDEKPARDDNDNVLLRLMSRLDASLSLSTATGIESNEKQDGLLLPATKRGPSTSVFSILREQLEQQLYGALPTQTTEDIADSSAAVSAHSPPTGVIDDDLSVHRHSESQSSTQPPLLDKVQEPNAFMAREKSSLAGPTQALINSDTQGEYDQRMAFIDKASWSAASSPTAARNTLHKNSNAYTTTKNGQPLDGSLTRLSDKSSFSTQSTQKHTESSESTSGSSRETQQKPLLTAQEKREAEESLQLSAISYLLHEYPSLRPGDLIPGTSFRLIGTYHIAHDLAIIAEKDGVCAVAFRGSIMGSLPHWTSNMQMDVMNMRKDRASADSGGHPDKLLRAHHGFVSTYLRFRKSKSFYSDIRQCVGGRSPKISEKKDLIITGHSRGGALASLMAIHLALDETASYDKKTGQELYDLSHLQLKMGYDHPIGKHKPLRVYTFGEPRSVAQDNFPHVPGVLESISKYRFVNKRDIIPNLPGCGYVHWGTEYHLQKDRSSTVSQEPSGSEERQTPTPKERNPPRNNEEESVAAINLILDFVEQCLDHFPSSYQQSFVNDAYLSHHEDGVTDVVENDESGLLGRLWKAASFWKLPAETSQTGNAATSSLRRGKKKKSGHIVNRSPSFSSVGA